MLTLMHGLVILGLSILTASLCSLFISQPLLKWIKQYTPSSRIILLRIFAAAPLGMGALLASMIIIPSINHSSILPLDHCHSTFACSGPLASHSISSAELVICVFLVGLSFWSIFSAWRDKKRSDTLINKLYQITKPCSMKSFRVLDSKAQMAFSVGIFNPIAVISHGLLQTMSKTQQDIVYAHEQVHLDHKDSYHKWLMKALSIFHWPSLRKTLLEHHAISIEMRADKVVATTVASPTDVAETLVALYRAIVSPPGRGSGLCGFAGSDLETRIHFLLEYKNEKALKRYYLLAFSLALVIGASISAQPLHNFLESIITWL